MWTKEKQNAYNKKYRLENKEKIKKIQSDYYAKNRQTRIENSKKWVALNKLKAKETRKLYRNTKQGKLKSIINSAKHRKIDFSLTSKQVFTLLDKNCFYCGQKDTIGIDRVDSNTGYTLENCIPCCSMCNYMKKDFKQSDFILQCKKIVAYF